MIRTPKGLPEQLAIVLTYQCKLVHYKYSCFIRFLFYKVKLVIAYLMQRNAQTRRILHRLLPASLQHFRLRIK